MPAGASTPVRRGPLTSPSDWWQGVAPATDREAAPAPGPGPATEGRLPGPGWPDLHTVEYLTKLIILGLLLMAVPWVLEKLITSPADGSRHAAGLLGAR